MNAPALPYHIFPLGDTAITIDFGNCIDEQINLEVITRYQQFLQTPLPGIIEIVPAYSSLTLYYDVASLKKIVNSPETVFSYIKKQAEERLQHPVPGIEIKERLIKIPVCYEDEFAMDILQLAAAKNLTVEEVIQLHHSRTYKVYMLGFLPGFAYMGTVNEKIAMPRKPEPVPIPAGSVGIAGQQTGIYPMVSPGGWQIIGRTPLKLFDHTKAEPTLLQAGDRVQFYSISRHEFENY